MIAVTPVGGGTAIVVRNLIGMCERASSRHRRWQEMREAAQDKKLGGCVRGEASIPLYFLIRDRSRRARRREKGYAPRASDKDADSDSPRGSI